MAAPYEFFKLVHVSDVLVGVLIFDVFKGAFSGTRGSNRYSIGLFSARLLFLHCGLSLCLLLLLHLLLVIFIVGISFDILVLPCRLRIVCVVVIFGLV